MPTGGCGVTLRGMSTVEGPDEELIAALVDELTRARQRGLDRLDGGPRLPRIEVPWLESLARKYADDQDSNRITLIRRLLDDALKDWERRLYVDKAKFVRGLFFTADGKTPGPGAGEPKRLLDKVKSDFGLDDESFNDERLGVFGLFARSLVGFVRTDRDDEPELSPSPPLPNFRMPWLITAAVLCVVVLIGIIWFVTRGDEDEATPPTSSTSSASSPQVAATFTFDALGGASPIINVYPGVSDSPADKIASGTFSSGQTVPAICKTTGRTVTSDVNAGEEQRESDAWIEVIEQAGVTHYASLTYGTMDQGGLELLPACDP
jgi:hypothetical protein